LVLHPTITTNHIIIAIPGKAVRIVKEECKSKTLLIGNGDVPNLEQARQKVAQFDVDGVMIGII